MKQQIENNFLASNRLTVADPFRIDNILSNSKLATQIESKGVTIEVVFTNKGKFDGSEVYYTLHLNSITSKQLEALLFNKRIIEDEKKRRRKAGQDSHRVLSRQRPTKRRD